MTHSGNVHKIIKQDITLSSTYFNACKSLIKVHRDSIITKANGPNNFHHAANVHKSSCDKGMFIYNWVYWEDNLLFSGLKILMKKIDLNLIVNIFISGQFFVTLDQLWKRLKLHSLLGICNLKFSKYTMPSDSTYLWSVISCFRLVIISILSIVVISWLLRRGKTHYFH